MFSKYGWKLFVLLIVAAAVFVWLIKTPILSTYISDKLRIPLTFRSISIWPHVTTIRHFQIPNPSSYSNAALKVDRIHIGYDTERLFGNPVEIDLIELDNAYLNIILPTDDRDDNNWTELGSHIVRSRTGKAVIVHKLAINNLTVNTEGAGAKKLGIDGVRQFNHMEFDEIDSRQGFPTEELINQIFKGAGIESYLRHFLNPENYLKKALNPLNKIFGKNEPPVSRGP